MISHSALSGYILEEVLAYLVQSAGYRLLTDPSQDHWELKTNRSGDLLVRGRGGDHQVDVLGEFTIVPAFSQPLRLFVEAKARTATTGLPVVRNAVGTVNDVNEAWMMGHSANKARRHYRYTIFSTSGFSVPAQNYAIAHQISLVDLSGPEWADLPRVVTESATGLLSRLPAHITRFPVRALRQVLREGLGTQPLDALNLIDNDAVASELRLHDISRALILRISETVGGALLVFPAGHQALLARPDNLERFLSHAVDRPEHDVSLALSRRQTTRTGRTWVVRPTLAGLPAYTLRLTLPQRVEARAVAESDRRAQSLAAKGELGGRLDVFWDPTSHAHGPAGPRVFRLMFAGVDLAHPQFAYE